MHSKFHGAIVDPPRALFYRPSGDGTTASGDSARRPTHSHPSMKSAKLTGRHPHDLAVLAPR
jgi:hypothetical protein